MTNSNTCRAADVRAELLGVYTDRQTGTHTRARARARTHTQCALLPMIVASC